MAKVTLQEITAGHGSTDLLNANFDAIEAALDLALYRDGQSPNAMTNDLDMNGNNILNWGSTAEASSWNFRQAWQTATAYAVADVVYVDLADSATNGGRTYYAITAHTSGTFDTDLASGYWSLVAERGGTGATGAGSGDLLASNNLSDLGNLTTGLNNLLTAHGPLATADIADNAITLDKLASGTDGELLTWDASGDPTTVAVGTSGQVLTSNGAGAEPTFQTPTSGTAASQAEVEAGTITTKYVSPGTLQYGLGQAKAWAGKSSSYNFASITKVGSGGAQYYLFTFTTPMSSANYAVIASSAGTSTRCLKRLGRFLQDLLL
jgi:hypothetical protein